MYTKGMLLVFVGLPGSGKDTIRRAFLQKHPDFSCIVTITTRPKHERELDDVHNFVSESEFEELIHAGALIEYVQFANHYYGTPKKTFQEGLEKVASGKNVFYLLDPKAATQLRARIKEFYGKDFQKSEQVLNDTVIVLIDMPPEEAAKRASLRGTSSSEIDERIARDSALIADNPEVFKYKIINKEGDIEGTVRQLEEIIK